MLTKSETDRREHNVYAYQIESRQIFDISGKFKQGIQYFQEQLKPICPKDLMELITSKDHEKEIQTKDGEVIGRQELRSLLDRSDLWEKFDKSQGLYAFILTRLLVTLAIFHRYTVCNFS